jgi:hypothetical protein
VASVVVLTHSSYAAIERFFAAVKASTSAQRVGESHESLVPRRRCLKKKIAQNRPFNQCLAWFGGPKDGYFSTVVSTVLKNFPLFSFSCAHV